MVSLWIWVQHWLLMVFFTRMWKKQHTKTGKILLYIEIKKDFGVWFFQVGWDSNAKVRLIQTDALSHKLFVMFLGCKAVSFTMQQMFTGLCTDCCWWSIFVSCSRVQLLNFDSFQSTSTECCKKKQDKESWFTWVGSKNETHLWCSI